MQAIISISGSGRDLSSARTSSNEIVLIMPLLCNDSTIFSATSSAGTKGSCFKKEKEASGRRIWDAGRTPSVDISGKEFVGLHLKNAFSKRMETSAEGVE